MSKNSWILLTLVCLFGACANDQSQVTPEKQSSRTSERETAKAAMDKEEAQRLAETHLALKQQNWGKVTEVTDVDDKFYVYYETPQRELRLLGPRVLIVDKDSRVVSFQRRR